MPLSRSDIVAEARAWIGTPYRHQASLKGVGCDCLGLVRAVWRAVIGDEPQAAPAYSRDWAEASGEEALAQAARAHLIEIAPGQFAPGDVLLFRYRDRYPAKHAAIVSASAMMGMRTTAPRSPRSRWRRGGGESWPTRSGFPDFRASDGTIVVLFD
jgi:NlpC/P60 family putative phage cell wall peptidase